MAHAKGEPMTKVSVKIRNITSPYMGVDRGRRLVAAIPNQEGRAFGKVCTSYDKPYLVYHGLVVDNDDILRHLEMLSSMGYNEFHIDTPES